MAASLLRATAARSEMKKGRIFPPFCFCFSLYFYFSSSATLLFPRLYNPFAPFK